MHSWLNGFFSTLGRGVLYLYDPICRHVCISLVCNNLFSASIMITYAFRDAHCSFEFELLNPFACRCWGGGGENIMFNVYYSIEVYSITFWILWASGSSNSGARLIVSASFNSSIIGFICKFNLLPQFTWIKKGE